MNKYVSPYQSIITIVTVLCMTLTAIIMIFSRNKIAKWYGLFFISSNIGFYVGLMKIYIFPYYSFPLLYIVKYVLTMFGYRFAPYFYLMANMIYSKVFNKEKERQFALLALIPLVLLHIMDFFFEKNIVMIDHIRTQSKGFWLTIVVSIVYATVAAGFGFIPAFKERKLQWKKLLAGFGLSIVCILSFFIYGVIKLQNSIVVLITAFFYGYLAVFVALAIRYKFLGIKVQIQMDSSLRAAETGTFVLNHAIKNEIGKIEQAVICIKESRPNPQALEMLELISDSGKYLLDLMKSITSQVQVIKVTVDEHSLAMVVNQVIANSRVLLMSKNVTVETQFNCYNSTILCDVVYLQEAIKNIVQNSVEAFRHSGTIKFQIDRRYHWIILTISDNANGIPEKLLPYVSEPFFTTKKTGANFGLGLSFVHNVIEQHKGKFEIKSIADVGTDIIISFPQKLNWLNLIDTIKLKSEKTTSI